MSRIDTFRLRVVGAEKLALSARDHVFTERVQEGFAAEAVDEAVHERVTEHKSGVQVHCYVERKPVGRVEQLGVLC